MNNKFPPNDDISFHQGTGDVSLDHWYYCQFVQNETVVETSRGGTEIIYCPLEHTPIFRSSVTGTVYENGNAVQIFIEENGRLKFQIINNPDCWVDGGNINLTTAEITLIWNKIPSKTSLIVSYEYNCETQ